jgi:hypothetical protein
MKTTLPTHERSIIEKRSFHRQIALLSMLALLICVAQVFQTNTELLTSIGALTIGCLLLRELVLRIKKGFSSSGFGMILNQIATLFVIGYSLLSLIVFKDEYLLSSGVSLITFSFLLVVLLTTVLNEHTRFRAQTQQIQNVPVLKMPTNAGMFIICMVGSIAALPHISAFTILEWQHYISHPSFITFLVFLAPVIFILIIAFFIHQLIYAFVRLVLLKKEPV